MSNAKRNNEGKPQLSLVLDLDESLSELAKVLEFGMEQYGRDNWKKGRGYRDTIDSLARHTLAFNNGENYDEESGRLHTAHIAANALFITYWHLNNVEGCEDRCEINTLDVEDDIFPIQEDIAFYWTPQGVGYSRGRDLLIQPFNSSALYSRDDIDVFSLCEGVEIVVKHGYGTKVLTIVDIDYRATLENSTFRVVNDHGLERTIRFDQIEGVVK